MSDSDKIRPRRWWIAAVVAVVAAWASYFYVGRPKRALVLLAIIVVIGAGAELLPYGTVGNFLAGSAAAGIVSVFILIDAVRIAIKSRDYRLRWFNRWWAYLGLGVLVVLLAVSSVLLTRTRVRNFSVPSSSMTPTIDMGDYFIADMQAFQAKAPQRGDLAIFNVMLKGKRIVFVKRIIGLPGDRVSLKDGVIWLNGVAVDREMEGSLTWREGEPSAHLYRETAPGGPTFETLEGDGPSLEDNFPEHEIPPDHFFVLGDFRTNSNDSRIPVDEDGLGDIARADLVGKPAIIYWSRDLHRIGTVLK